MPNTQANRRRTQEVGSIRKGSPAPPKHSQPGQSPRKLVFAIIWALMVGFAAFVGFLANATTVIDSPFIQSIIHFGKKTPDGEVIVNDSRLLPYNAAGRISTNEELNALANGMSNYSEAFSMLSFLSYSGEQSEMVKTISVEIESCEPVVKPEISILPCFSDNTLYIFAINNGWGSFNDSIDIQFNRNYIGKDRDNAWIAPEIVSSGYSIPQLELAAGDVCLVARYELNVERFLAFSKDMTVPGGLKQSHLFLVPDVSFNNLGLLFGVWYSEETGFRVYRFLDGGGEPVYDQYSVSLFATYDVDEANRFLYFTDSGASPLIQKETRVEVVIAPTKSCSIECRLAFDFGNDKILRTDLYGLSVWVPYYSVWKDDRGYTWINKEELNSFTSLLLMHADEGQAALREAIEPYRWRPERVVEEATEGDS